MAALVMSKFVSVLFILNLFFFLAMPSPSGTNTQNFTNRKTLHGAATRSASVNKVDKVNNKFYGGELREAPRGPDPLHHHGLAPNKPRTDP
ncbi:hypothetical protein LIER_14606 [Lithospermum erythrorhizon]|uniref:Uncharacterized protein n=1 Tax=Lithospermum erythrorhizon TaxID=34254 RepID=A0AAV3Q3W1_LITER